MSMVGKGLILTLQSFLPCLGILEYSVQMIARFNSKDLQLSHLIISWIRVLASSYELATVLPYCVK